jgi:hypothetical protein
VNINKKASTHRKARYIKAAQNAETNFSDAVNNFYKANAAENLGMPAAVSAGVGRGSEVAKKTFEEQD